MYMEQLQLSISPAQMTKIRKGLPIQISHGSMGNGDVVISLRPEKAKKMVSAFKRGKGLRIQMDEDEVRASGLLGDLKKIGKKVEKGVVDVGKKVAKPTKKIISKIPKPVRDVLQEEAQGMIDSTGSTLGIMIGKATGDEELGDMIQKGISDTGNELLSGQRLSLGSKILPIAKRSVNLVVDEIEDPKYKALAKQIVKKSGAGLYGKAGSGLTGQGLRGQGLSGQGLSGSGMRKRRPMPDFDEEDMGKMKILPHRPDVMPRYGKERPSIKRPAVMPNDRDMRERFPRTRMPRTKPRFEKGSQEAKDYMASIRNNKQGSGFFKKIGKQIKKRAKNLGKDIEKGAKETGKDFKKGASKGKRMLFGKRIGDEAAFVLPIAGSILGGTAGSMMGGPLGGSVGSSAGGAGGKALADEINKRGYGMKVGRGQRNPLVKPAHNQATFSPYAQLSSGQNHPFTPRSSFQNGGTGELIM